MTPFKSLDGATATGPGAVLDTRKLTRVCVAQLDFSGSASGLNLAFEASLNGQTWYEVGRLWQLPNDWPSTYASQTGSVGGRYFRANLAALPGGGSPSVTVTFVEAD